MAKARTKSVGDQLANIDAMIKAKVPAVAASLAPGAKPAAIDKLKKLFGAAVPDAVRAWFAWHDGHRRDTYNSLIPDTNWSALSVKGVLDTYQFLDGTSRVAPDEIMQPWKGSWLPMFENGAGDHLCYDRDTGVMVTWYHDDAMRPKAYKSFTALVDAIEKGYAKMPAVKGFAGPAVKNWTAVARAPSEAQLAKLPIGSAFHYPIDLPMGHRETIHVKLGDDRWLRCSSVTLKKALALWTELAAKPPAESSGYYHNGWNTWYALKNNKKSLKQAT